MIEQYQKRLYRLKGELDRIIYDLWHPADTGDGFEPLIELNEWRNKLAELERDMWNAVSTQEVEK